MRRNNRNIKISKSERPQLERVNTALTQEIHGWSRMRYHKKAQDMDEQNVNAYFLQIYNQVELLLQ
jgi:hypothetical protein